MPRLFVAVDLPPDAVEQLVCIQPPPVEGLRLVDAARMHLTLHFLGEADAEPIAAALQPIALPPFELEIGGVGQFGTSQDKVLWAGVLPSEGLARLHRVTAAFLALVGFRPEPGRYKPHVTLARCRRRAAADVVPNFLTRNSSFILPSFPVTAFALYSSANPGGTHVYRRERSYPLRPPSAAK